MPTPVVRWENASVFDENGAFVGTFSFHSNQIPDELQLGTYYIVPDYAHVATNASLEEIIKARDAKLVFGRVLFNMEKFWEDVQGK